MTTEGIHGNPDSDKRALFESLWGLSDGNPYDKERESRVARRRFAPAILHTRGRLEQVRTTEQRNLRVLDFGCSDGHTAQHILGEFASEVDYFGNDLYLPAATQDRMRKLGFNAEVAGGSLDGIPGTWPAFDVVLALSCFQYITNPDDVFARLVSRLEVGGILVAYFYDASPLRRCTDDFLRERFGPQSLPTASAPDLTEGLSPLVSLVEALRDATEGRTISIPATVPQLGIPAGTIPLQQFLIDYVLFAWAPQGATTSRVAWALTEMFQTGAQTYIGLDDIDRLLVENAVDALEVIPGPSGHLVVGVKADREG